MKIDKTKNIAGCLETSNVRDILFDDLITKEFTEYLGKLGKLILNEKLTKPFFTIIVHGKYTIKGSVGNKSCRILLAGENWENYINELEEYVEKFK